MAAPKASAAPAGLGGLDDDLDAPAPAAGAGAGAAGFGGGFGGGMPPIGVPLPAMPVTGVPMLSKAISAASAPSTGILQLQLKLDYPAKVLFTKLDAKTTVGQLKEECGKAFGLKGEELRRHQFHTVSYGRNPSQLGVRDKVGDAATLSEEGVRDRGTVLLVAPVDLKPVRDFEVKKKAEEEDDDDADNRYRGLKPSTIVKVMQQAKGRDELVCLEYFDMNASKAMRAPEWLQLEQKRVMQLIQRSTLNIKEGELFEHVVAWGKAEAKRQGLDTTPDSLRKVLANLLGHIRFPCMGMDEVATKVTPSGILTGEQMLQVFTYLGLSKDKAAAMKMPFPTVPRTGRRLPHHFTWDPNYKHYSVQLSDKNMTASTNDMNNWQNVAGSVELKKGVHEWEVVLQQYDAQNGYNVVIGVVPSYWNNWSNPAWIGASAAAPGWAYICGNGYKCSQTQGQQYYGAAAGQGGVVKVRLDLDKHTIEFSVNGASQGVAFHDVYGPVRAAVSMCRPQKFQLRFPNKAAADD